MRCMPIAMSIGLLAGCDGSSVRGPKDEPPDAGPAEAPRILVFSRTTGVRHTSISPGIAAITELGRGLGFEVEATEDPALFVPERLRRFRSVVFLSTSGDILDAAQEASFERFIHDGGGFVGVHSATDTEYDWPFYQRLVGAAFSRHPAGTPRGGIRVVDDAHPSTAHLPAVWGRDDEWYSLRASPRVFPEVHVLLELDEDSVPLAPELRMPGGHPVSWYQAYGGGRAFTTTLGHSDESYAEPAFRQHLAGALAWATTGARDPQMLVHDLDGVTPPGTWRPHGTPFPFDFTVDVGAFRMFDQGGLNQHVTREALTLPAGSSYSIDTLFSIPRVSRNGATDPFNSFCINFDVQGANGRDDDHAQLYARALNLDLSPTEPHTGVTKFMGFVDGGVRTLGGRVLQGVDFDVEYRMTLDVNRDATGAPKKDVTTFRLTRGTEDLASFDVDFTAFPYAPDPSKPVRVGVNTHGTDWVMRDFRVRQRTSQ